MWPLQFQVQHRPSPGFRRCGAWISERLLCRRTNLSCLIRLYGISIPSKGQQAQLRRLRRRKMKTQLLSLAMIPRWMKQSSKLFCALVVEFPCCVFCPLQLGFFMTYTAQRKGVPVKSHEPQTALTPFLPPQFFRSLNFLPAKRAIPIFFWLPFAAALTRPVWAQSWRGISRNNEIACAF